MGIFIFDIKFPCHFAIEIILRMIPFFILKEKVQSLIDGF